VGLRIPSLESPGDAVVGRAATSFADARRFSTTHVRYRTTRGVLEERAALWNNARRSGATRGVLEYRAAFWSTARRSGVPRAVLEYRAPFWSTARRSGATRDVMEQRAALWSNASRYRDQPGGK